MRVRAVGLAAVASVLLGASIAIADPIVITAGSAGGNLLNDPGGFELIGDKTLIVSDAFGPAPPAGFAGGDTVVISGTVRPQSILNNPGNATISGTFYPSVWLFGSLDFVGAPFVAPPAQPGAVVSSFQTTFVMNGHLEGYANRNQTGPLFAVAVTGSGLASAGPYLAFDDNRWISPPSSGAVNFTFSAADPSPTPEPATMVLLASGLVIAGARRFRASRG